MQGLVISSSNKADLDLLMALAGKIGMKIKSLSSDDMKHLGLVNLLDTDELKISKETFLDDLKTSLKEVKKMKEGKIEKQTLKDTFNDR